MELDYIEDACYESKEINSLRLTLIERDAKIKQLLDDEKKLILENKQLENIIELHRSILRDYVFKLKESTNTSIAAQDGDKFEQNQYGPLEDSIDPQNEFLEKLNTYTEQAKQTLATETARVTSEYAKLETLIERLNNKLEHQIRCSQNLENILKQFSQKREQQTDENFCQYEYALGEKTPIDNPLTNENNLIGDRFSQYNELLSDIDRLNDKIRRHYFLINRLINENHDQDLQIKEYKREINLNNNLFSCQAPLSASTNSFVNTTDLTLNQEPSAALLPPTNVEENSSILDLSTIPSSTPKNRKFLDRLKFFFKL
ncbi:unnamed protein product [Rotaria sordida]|uniref:Uncharacterized protein n=1 Tax=Rotaria sordida TaxID=392033 RepID=A0A819KDI9_9BILA|nr:unnamed protein product [Rotaria sordida]